MSLPRVFLRTKIYSYDGFRKEKASIEDLPHFTPERKLKIISCLLYLRQAIRERTLNLENKLWEIIQKNILKILQFLFCAKPNNSIFTSFAGEMTRKSTAWEAKRNNKTLLIRMGDCRDFRSHDHTGTSITNKKKIMTRMVQFFSFHSRLWPRWRLCRLYHHCFLLFSYYEIRELAWRCLRHLYCLADVPFCNDRSFRRFLFCALFGLDI